MRKSGYNPGAAAIHDRTIRVVLVLLLVCVGGGLPAGHDESVAARTSFRGSAWPVPLHALAMGAGAVGRTGDNAGFLAEGGHWYDPLTRSA